MSARPLGAAQLSHSTAPSLASAPPMHGGLLGAMRSPLPQQGHGGGGDFGYPTASESIAALQMAAIPSGPQSQQSFELDRPLREARDAFEKSYFEFHLAKENGSMTRVAEKTGLERTHLYRKLKQLGVDLTRNKRGGGGG
jgi:DNA-binding NtrC family response regulator